MCLVIILAVPSGTRRNPNMKLMGCAKQLLSACWERRDETRIQKVLQRDGPFNYIHCINLHAYTSFQVLASS